MNLRLKANEKEELLWLPCEERVLQNFCNKMDIANTTQTKVEVIEVYNDEKLSEILSNKSFKLDELNFFFKLHEGMSDREKQIFYAVADAKNPETMKELINLTANTNCIFRRNKVLGHPFKIYDFGNGSGSYHLVDDFNNLKELGRNLYLNEQNGVYESVLREFDGQKYVEDILKSQTPLISKYGLIYTNENTEQQIMKTDCFPSYWYKPCPITLCVETESDRDFLYLPCVDSEADKALERLSVNSLGDVKLSVEDYDLAKEVADIALKDVEFEKLNDFAKTVKTHGVSFETDELIKAIKVDNIDDLKTLIENQYEFEFIPNINNFTEYGKFMLKESGRYEFDENLEEYFDFEQYGVDRGSSENGRFVDNGYLVYRGYSHEMEQVLRENIGLEVQNDYAPQELKLYMPLSVTTYDEENSWGVYEKQDFEIELDSYEIADFEDEINDFIEEYDSDLGERGLMEYYDKKDSINAKVKSYRMSVENIDHELMGVMTLQLNAPLTEKELEAFIESETGQMSDGWGEGFEQRDIKCDGRDINISFWSSDDNWEISTAEELGITEQKQGMRGMSL